MLILDANIIVALSDGTDPQHTVCAELVREAQPPIVVPAFAAAEAAYLVGDHLGARAELRFARSIAAGELFIEPVASEDWPRIVELTERYQDLPLGITDASVLAATERLGVTSLATLDRRHFTVVRPRHVPALRLLPDQLA